MKHFAENAFMRKWPHINLLIILIGSFTRLLSAQERPLGSWQLHPSYQTIRHITGNQEIIFAASENGLFSLRPGSGTNPLTKTSGLSDQGVGAIQYIEGQSALLVGYRSGIIDLVTSDNVKTDKAIYHLDDRLEKTIYDMVVNEHAAYFASSLGVIQYDLQRAKAQDIYQSIGPGATEVICYQIALANDSLFAFSNIGLLVGNTSDNLLDFGKWKLRIAQSFNESTLVANNDDSVFFATNNLLIRTHLGNIVDTLSFPQTIHSLSSASNKLMIASGSQLYEYADGQITLQLEATGKLTAVSGEIGGNWLGVESLGLLNINESQYFLPSGPLSDNYSHLVTHGESVELGFGQDSLSIHEKGAWDTEILAPNSQIVKTITIDGKRYALDKLQGLYDFAAGSFIPRPVQDGQFTDIIHFDGMTMISLESSATPFTYSENIDSWTPVSQQSLGTSSVYSLDHSVGGTIYMTSGAGRLIAYDMIDRIVKKFNQTDITDYCIDQNDELYVTTHEGLYYYSDATFVFDNQELREAFISGGQLLQEDNYTSVAVDAGNRKWLATDKGLWLYSENMSDELSHYNQDNSSLPSNEIDDLHFHPETGLLWIKTSNGLANLQTDALIEQPYHENVTVFPNPFYISSGMESIGIKGLAQDVTVKITTLSGVYIDEVTSNGSSTSWDLRDYRGGKVSPGIYLLFSSDDTGTETFVGKFLVEQ
jgi:hypothetical protein